jgi:hypothetical protein
MNLKEQVYWSFKGKKHLHEETCTILQEAALIGNSCPLAGSPGAEKEKTSC